MPFGISTNNRANVAFKNILGRSQTRDIHDLGNEPFGVFISTPAKVIWTSTVLPSRWESISNGIAVEIESDLVLHPNSDGHGYSTVYPTDAPSGIDPKTGIAFAYGVGTFEGVGIGDRILDIIPPTFNIDGGKISDFASGYTPRLYSDIGMSQEIDLLDDRDWIYQFQSGIYFQQDVKSPAPLKIRVWKYIGETLDESLVAPIDLSLTGLTDVNFPTFLVEGETLIYSGGSWINAPDLYITDGNFTPSSGDLELIRQDGSFHISLSADTTEPYYLDSRYARSVTGLTDVNFDSLSQGDYMIYSGDTWVNQNHASQTGYFITGFTGNSVTIDHNFGVFPDVMLLDSSGYEIEGSVKNLNIWSVEIVFNNFNGSGSVICTK